MFIVNSKGKPMQEITAGLVPAKKRTDSARRRT
jgi:hypothetical protein